MAAEFQWLISNILAGFHYKKKLANVAFGSGLVVEPGNRIWVNKMQ